MPGWRSLLFVPGDNAERLAKAHSRGADAVIIDLEDAVAAAAKPAARGLYAASAAALAAQGSGVIARINASWRMIQQDIDAVVIAPTQAIIVPKVESSAQLSVIGDMIGEIEQERGLPVGGIGLIALVESPLGLARMARIAAVPRVRGLALGSEDFSLALGAPPTPASLDLPCRQLALAAATHGLAALGLPISIAEFRDLEAYEAAARTAKSYGVTGTLCIHPAQVAVVNAVFQPSDAERAEARAIVEAWDAAQAAGQAVLSLNGRMIDLPVIERARRLLG